MEEKKHVQKKYNFICLVIHEKFKEKKRKYVYAFFYFHNDSASFPTGLGWIVLGSLGWVRTVVGLVSRL